MIRAFLFDLDGTLVQTEILKAISYARAAVQLRPYDVTEAMVIEAFRAVVGLSRHEVVRYLMERFQLEESARVRMGELNATTPDEAFARLRMRVYESMLADEQTLRDHLLPHNVDLLRWAKNQRYQTGLATMSHSEQAFRVLRILNIDALLDVVAARDDVQNGKPDPEIYHLVARHLGVDASECVVIEDSASGVRAAINAGMDCIVVTTELTRQSVHEGGLLDARRIVDDPGDLEGVIQNYLQGKV
jgi:HAD superfamily hydrolase (TIGR01509 family)